MSYTLSSLEEVAKKSRELFDEKINSKNETKYILFFAYNGTGKTRLSMEFKDISKKEGQADTLYYNAFTEDLFIWDNDLDHDYDHERELILNQNSKFFPDIKSLEIEAKVRGFLHRYSDFNFVIELKTRKDNETGKESVYWAVNFFRDVLVDGTMKQIYNIKVSRGEESIFIWCFFLAIVQLVIDNHDDYKWVKYLYIDDPISSLDDNNAIYVASHLAQLLKDEKYTLKTVISSHHSLFYNVMWNELNATRNLRPYFLSKESSTNLYTLEYTKDTPFFYHVAMIRELHEVIQSGNIYAYHFNILRSILEKTSGFLGFKKFSDCIHPLPNDEEGIILARIIEILNHGNYSIYEPRQMEKDNKKHFKQIFYDFVNNYNFNRELYPEEITQESQA